MNQSLTLAFLIAAGIGLVVQNTLMVRITQTSSTILIAMLLNSLVGIVLFVSILWFKQGMAGVLIHEKYEKDREDIGLFGIQRD